MMDFFKTMHLKVREHMNGLTVELMRDSGRPVKWTDMECLLGSTA